MKRVGMVVASLGTAAVLAGGIAAVAALATGSPGPEVAATPPAAIGAPSANQALTGAGYAQSGATQQPAAAPRDNRSWGVFNALVGDEQTRARRADEQRAAAAAARQPTRQASGDDDDDDDGDD